jgi:hypothetical protein
LYSPDKIVFIQDTPVYSYSPAEFQILTFPRTGSPKALNYLRDEIQGVRLYYRPEEVSNLISISSKYVYIMDYWDKNKLVAIDHNTGEVKTRAEYYTIYKFEVSNDDIITINALTKDFRMILATVDTAGRETILSENAGGNSIIELVKVR